MSPIDLLRDVNQPIRLDVPIKTPRLLLRPFDAQLDIGPMTALFGDQETTRWIGGVKTEIEVNASVYRMSHSFRSWGFGTLAVVPLGETDCIGYCGVRALTHTQDVELAFGIKKSHWGFGFATEASIACLQSAFRALPLSSIVATVYPANERSISVLTKLGMKPEAEIFGTWPHPLALLFRLTREDWQQNSSPV
jgi:[ribosomal protein S5]-alanine N-acetyltransferase